MNTPSAWKTFPVPDCGKLVQRIDKHLITDSLAKTDQLYIRYKTSSEVMSHNWKRGQNSIEPPPSIDIQSSNVIMAQPQQPCLLTTSTALPEDQTSVDPANITTPCQEMSSDQDANIYNCHINVMSELNEYYNWLTSIDGGWLAARVANQHKVQVKQIVTFIGIVCPKTGYCCEHGILGDKLREWFKEANGSKVGTIRSKISSLQKLLDFWLQMRYPVHKKLDRDELLVCKQRILSWSKSLRKADLEQRHLRQIHARQNMLTPSDVKTFRLSRYRNKLLALFRKSKSTIDSMLTISIRNLLLNEILLANAQRPSALVGMTKHDWNCGVWQKNGFFSVSVIYHKTFSKTFRNVKFQRGISFLT